MSANFSTKRKINNFQTKFRILIGILFIVSVISGCGTESYIKDSLRTKPHANQYAAAVVLPINLESKETAKRISNYLKAQVQTTDK